jgi:hypothetical protein
MEIGYLATEEELADAGQKWIAEIFIQERHRSSLHSALKAITHHQIEPHSQFF